MWPLVIVFVEVYCLVSVSSEYCFHPEAETYREMESESFRSSQRRFYRFVSTCLRLIDPLTLLGSLAFSSADHYCRL
jgi:hypothetical protein